MIERIVNDCERLTILEMRMYLRAEISKFSVSDYRTMTEENKFILYKLNSFLYFCNEIKDKDLLLKAMREMCSKKFKDRNKVYDPISKTKGNS